MKYEDFVKMLNQKVTYKLHQYYALKFLLGTKNGIPVLIMFNDNNILKISQNKTEIIISNDILSTCIDIIYLLFYDYENKY